MWRHPILSSHPYELIANHRLSLSVLPWTVLDRDEGILALEVNIALFSGNDQGYGSKAPALLDPKGEFG